MGGLVGALPVSALSSCASGTAVDEVKEGASDAKNGKITFLQTTDVHCQLHQHDELFWENEEIVFRRTGVMLTSLQHLKN
jgi:S-sulfosulfanyl-L-cysteine sulfohydrolase